MTPRRSLGVVVVVGLLVLAAAAAATDGPPLLRSGFRQGSATPRQGGSASPPPAGGAGRGAAPGSVLQQVARQTLPASLWAALPAWPAAPHAAPDAATHRYTNLQQEGDGGKGRWPGFNFYLPDTTNASWACKKDVATFHIELIRGKTWALQMVDSWGKFPDGILGGNTLVPGLLDECLHITVDQELPQAHFRGQYCAVSYKAKEAGQGEARRGTEEAGVRMAAVAGSLGLAIPMNLYGTCIPSSCTRQEYKDSLETQLARHHLQLGYVVCQTEELPALQYSAADVIMIVVLCLLGLLVVAGTGGDVWVVYTGRSRQDTGPLRYVLVFSFYTNLKKMFRINLTPSHEVISCLHGIRVLSLAWVVLAHTYLLSLSTSANKIQMLRLVKETPYFYQVIFNGYVAVDTFFVMSGLLVSYNLTKEFNKTRKFNIPLYYIHRFLRLAPAILLLSGIFAVFPPLVIRGVVSPLMTEPGYLVDLCRRHWWRDGLFITNFFFTESGSDLVVTEACLPVCWYTAVDSQLYLVTPLILLPLLYRRKPGATWLAFLMLVSVAIPAIIIGVNKLPPAQVLGSSSRDTELVLKLIYNMPWCRASPYLVGLALGYLLRAVSKDKIHLTWWQAGLGWVAALATTSAVVFGLADYNTLSLTPHEYVPAISIIYGGLHRLAWGVAVAWVVFACHMGYGGPVNGLLAHPYWQPVSRLTYAIFLISFNAQFLVKLMTCLPTYSTNFSLLMEAAAMLVLATCAGVVLSLLAESPVLGLEKLLLRRDKQ